MIIFKAQRAAKDMRVSEGPAERPHPTRSQAGLSDGRDRWVSPSRTPTSSYRMVLSAEEPEQEGLVDYRSRRGSFGHPTGSSGVSYRPPTSPESHFRGTNRDSSDICH